MTRALLVVVLACGAAPAMAQWRAGGGAVVLARGSEGRVTTVASYTHEPLLTTDDADRGAAVGWQVFVSRRVGRRGTASARWLVVSHEGSASATSEDNRLDPVFGWRGDYRTDDFDLAWRHRIGHDTSLRWLDLRFERATGARWTWHAGLRAGAVGEHLELVSQDESPADGGGDVGRYAITTDNDLLGPASGFAARWRLGRRTDLSLGLTAGVLHARSSQRSLLRNDGVLEVDASRGASGACALLEVGADARWWLGRWLELGVGYEALWLSGLALAPDQLARENTVAAARALDRDGAVLYHGLGVSLAWRR